MSRLILLCLLPICACEKGERDPVAPSISISVSKAFATRNGILTIDISLESPLEIATLVAKSTPGSELAIPFDKSKQSQSFTFEFKISDVAPLGTADITVTLTDIKGRTASKSTPFEVVAGEGPVVNVTDQEISGTPGKTVRFKLVLTAAEGIDSLNVFVNARKFAAFTKLPTGIFAFDFLLPEDAAYEGNEATIEYQLVDKLGRRSSKVAQKLKLIVPATQVFIFNPLTATGGVVGTGRDMANNNLTFYGYFDDKGVAKVETIVLEKSGTDSLYSFVLDEKKRVSFAYGGLKGQTPGSNVIVYTYPSDTIVTVAFHDYNWLTKQSKLVAKMDVNMENGKGKLTQVGRTKDDLDWDLLSIPVHAMRSIGPRTVTAFVGLALAVSFPTYAVPIGLTTALVIVSGILDTANASEGGVVRTSQPPVNSAPNSSSGASIPSSGPDPCVGVHITFDAKMDHEGTIIIFSITGGSPTYSFSINDSKFQTNQGFANKYPEGSYKIYVRDANGCIGGSVILLKRPAPCPTITVSADLDISGKITIMASGGKLPYQYSVNDSPLQPSNVLAGPFQTGDYNIRIKDAEGCEAHENITLSRECAVEAMATITAAGAITVEALFGTPPYKYKVDDSPYQTTPVFNGPFENGLHRISVVDATECEVTKERELIRNCGIEVSASFGANRSISVLASGGEAPYMYSLKNSPYQSSPTFAGPHEAGTYLIKVKDANGCAVSRNVPLDCIPVNAPTSFTDILFKNSNTVASYNGTNYLPEFVAQSILVQMCSDGSAQISFYASTKLYPMSGPNMNTPALITNKGLVTLSDNICVNEGWSWLKVGWQVERMYGEYGDGSGLGHHLLIYYLPASTNNDNLFKLSLPIPETVCD